SSAESLSSCDRSNPSLTPTMVSTPVFRRSYTVSYQGVFVTGALDGVRVVDFGQYIAGPLAALMLADQGAEVIHVDPPGGPRWRSDADAFYNRAKQRIDLDLKEPSGCATASRLIHTADVVVENFRPGVMERLGL